MTEPLSVDALRLLMDERHARYEERAAWQEKLRLAELEQRDRALVLADVENKHRLEELNNLRREYTSDRGGFVTVPALDALKEQQEERHLLLVGAIAEVRSAVTSAQSARSGLSQGLGYVVGAISLVIALAVFFSNR